VAVFGQQRFSAMLRLEVVREGRALAGFLGGTQAFELLAALGDQLVMVFGRMGVVFLRHGTSGWGRARPAHNPLF